MFTFFPRDDKCEDLEREKTQYKMTNLTPFTSYYVSLKAYTLGKVQRNGNVERRDCKTNPTSKFYALMLLSVNGKEQSMNF